MMIQAISQRSALDTEVPAPFRQGFGLSIERQPSTNATVVELFLASCPTTIFRSVMAIIIYPFQRVFLRESRSHIGKEISRRLPAFANRYPSTTITFVVGFVGVFASMYHAQPYAVVGMVRQSMSDNAASTATRFSRREITGVDSAMRSTVTAALPILRQPLFESKIQDEPAAKALSDQVHLSALFEGSY
jgi:hypothetical protein